MKTITLKAIQAKQTELATMIQQLEAQAATTTLIEVEACTITLQPGEHYAGAMLNDTGQHKHHLVLMAQRPTNKLNWQAAMDWAKRIGGTLPTRQEQALLFANCKSHLETAWHWSSEVHESDASSAWYCGFSYGGQGFSRKSYEGSAVAVRLIQLGASKSPKVLPVANGLPYVPDAEDDPY